MYIEDVKAQIISTAEFLCFKGKSCLQNTKLPRGSVVLRWLFSVLVFIGCLALTEAFFVLNSKYQWIQPSQTHRLRVGGEEPLPEVLIEHVSEKYKKEHAALATSELATSDLDLTMRPGFKEQKITPELAGPLQVYFDSYPNVRELRDTMSDADGHVIYDATYGFDDFGRRRIPGQKIDEHKPNLLLLGCSQTFGQGVQDDETMPYFMQQLNPGYNVYNMGISGAGLSEILDDMQSKKRFADLGARGGVVVYSFIYDHLERMFCSVDCYRTERVAWVPKKNHYDFDEQGNLTNYGPHRYRWLRAGLYRWFAKSQFLNFIGYDRPRVYSASEQRRFVRMLKEVELFYRKFGYDFYLYPWDSGSDFGDTFKSELKRAGIKFIDYKLAPIQLLRAQGTIPGDGHPNAFGHYIAATLITQMLKDKPPEIPAVQASFSSEPDKN